METVRTVLVSRGHDLALRVAIRLTVIAEWAAIRIPGARIPGLPAIRGLIREAGTFGGIGLAIAVVDIILFSALHVAGVGPMTSKTISGLITMVISYYANRRWTWPHRPGTGQQRRQLLQFIAISSGGLLIAEACLAFTHYVLGLRGLLADNISANVIGLGVGGVWRFAASRYWIFTAVADGSADGPTGPGADGGPATDAGLLGNQAGPVLQAQRIGPGWQPPVPREISLAELLNAGEPTAGQHS